MEEGSLRRIARELPREEGEELLALWRELEGGKSREARLVKELDILDMAFKAEAYSREGYEGMEEFKEVAGNEVRKLREVFEEILE